MSTNPYLYPNPPVDPPPAPAQRKRPHKVRNFVVFPTVAVLAAGAIVAAAVRNSAPPTPPAPTAFTLHGGFILHGSYNEFTGADVFQEDDGGCHGQGGYSDIADGAQVIVTSGATTLGIGQLENSVYAGGDCDFQFTVKNVPLGKAFYGVSVTHRGAVQESEADAKSGNVALSLGDGS